MKVYVITFSSVSVTLNWMYKIHILECFSFSPSILRRKIKTTVRGVNIIFTWLILYIFIAFGRMDGWCNSGHDYTWGDDLYTCTIHRLRWVISLSHNNVFHLLKLITIELPNTCSGRFVPLHWAQNENTCDLCKYTL